MTRQERKARADEVASNGLTRREMHADLEARNVGFDPRESVASLANLHKHVTAHTPSAR